MAYKTNELKKAKAGIDIIDQNICDKIMPKLDELLNTHEYERTNHIHKNNYRGYTEGLYSYYLNQVKDELSSYKVYEELNKPMQDVVSSQIYFEHMIMNVSAKLQNNAAEYKSVTGLVFKTLFDNIDSIETVNFGLCYGMKPISLYISFANAHPLNSESYSLNKGVENKIIKLIKKGADIEEPVFLSYDVKKYHFKEYDLQKFEDIQRKSYSQEVSGSLNSSGFSVEKLQKLTKDIEDASNSKAGFAWKDYVYTGIGTGLCAFTVSGINVPVAGAATPAYYFCAGVPVTDLGFDYFGVTEKYYASSFFIAYNGIHYGFKYAPAAMHTAINNYFTTEAMQMPERIANEGLPQQNVPVFVPETPRKNDFNPHLEGRSSIGKHDMMGSVNKVDSYIKSRPAKQELHKIGQKMDVASQNYKDSLAQRSHYKRKADIFEDAYTQERMQNANIRNKYNEYSNKYDEQYKNLEDTYATVQFQQKTFMEKAAVVAKVGGAAVMTPYIKGIYDYTIDSVCSVFSSDEQDL